MTIPFQLKFEEKTNIKPDGYQGTISQNNL